MARLRVQAYRDPAMDEYVFNALATYPAWAKEKLTPKELSIFKSKATIRMFVSNATMDQKCLMLAKANIRFVSIFFDMNQEKLFDFKNLDKLYRDYSNPKKRKYIIDNLTESNTFFTSSREVLTWAYLIAQNAHTPYYYINQDFKKVQYSMEIILRTGGTTDIEDIKFSDHCRTVVAKYFLGVLESDNYTKTVLKMEPMDIRILMIFFIHRDVYLEKQVIHRYMNDYAALSISNRLGALQRTGYLHSQFTTGRSPKFTIAELGIIAVNEILHMVSRKAIEI